MCPKHKTLGVNGLICLFGGILYCWKSRGNPNSVVKERIDHIAQIGFHSISNVARVTVEFQYPKRKSTFISDHKRENLIMVNDQSLKSPVEKWIHFPWISTQLTKPSPTKSTSLQGSQSPVIYALGTLQQQHIPKNWKQPKLYSKFHRDASAWHDTIKISPTLSGGLTNNVNMTFVFFIWTCAPGRLDPTVPLNPTKTNWAGSSHRVQNYNGSPERESMANEYHNSVLNINTSIM